MIERRQGERRYVWTPLVTSSPEGKRLIILPLQWQMKSCGEALTAISLTRRHCDTNWNSHKEAAVAYVLDRRRSVRAPRFPAMQKSEDGRLLFKCDDPQCHVYVENTQLRRTRVMLTINDPAKPKGVSMVMVERDLCPHCFVLSSKNGTQRYNPTPAGFARSKSDLLWREKDRRSAADVDPEYFKESRKRYEK